MRAILRPHSDWPPTAVRSITVEVARTQPGGLSLRYLVEADPGALAVPPPADPARTDELWKHTCFEAFLRAPGAEPYAELNLAPSGQWAAYAFDRPREGMRDADLPPPAIAWDVAALALEAEADLSMIDVLDAGGPWRLSITAVIEETSGAKSYWALAHPPGRPDFHALDGFTLTLPGPTSE
jgi:hypothetical protein